MFWFKYLLLSLISSITLMITLFSYAKLSDNYKFKLSIKNIIVLFVSGILITININANTGYSRALIGYLITIINCYIVFRDNLNLTFIKGTFCYLLSMVFEIVLYVFLIATKMFNLKIIDNNLFVKFLFSIATVAIPYGILSIKSLNKMFKKLIKILNRPIITCIVFIFCLLSFLFTQ